jgi:hypothetical protein
MKYLHTAVLASTCLACLATNAASAAEKVTVGNFTRAETDMYMSKAAADGSFGQLHHKRVPVSVDAQTVIRMNRDTLYSVGVFDLDAAPVTVTLPDAGQRYMSLQVLTEDVYTADVIYAPGTFTYTKDKVGTRYVYFIVRTLADASDPADVTKANAMQDQVKVVQATSGTFEVPQWDKASQDKARSALLALGSLGGTGAMFGRKEEVDPVSFLIGAAAGWGGLPPSGALYNSIYPAQNDGQTVYGLSVKDVPVDGFWSISVYNAEGYFQKNDLDAYSVNNLTGKANPDRSYTVQFGGCRQDTPNCLPIVAGWNYTVRLYRPRKAVRDGQWKFPEAQPIP